MTKNFVYFSVNILFSNLYTEMYSCFYMHGKLLQVLYTKTFGAEGNIFCTWISVEDFTC